MSSDSTSDDVNEIVEVNIPTEPSKSIEFPCPEYTFMVVPIKSYFSESSEFFAVIQHVISNAFLFLIVSSLCLILIYLHSRG